MLLRPFRPSLLRPRRSSLLRPMLALSFFTAGVGVGASPVAAQEAGIAVGAKPDAIVLETLDGEPAALSNRIGERPVLLEFWATWCAVCRALEPTMNAVDEAYGDAVDIVVVAAAVGQTQEGVRQHLARHRIPGEVLWDTRGRFTRAFDAPGTGYVVILDADGIVAYTGTGADQDLVGAMAEVLGTK